MADLEKVELFSQNFPHKTNKPLSMVEKWLIFFQEPPVGIEPTTY
jgi:hypothetical protein